jgi:hypothetical protein
MRCTVRALRVHDDPDDAAGSMSVGLSDCEEAEDDIVEEEVEED